MNSNSEGKPAVGRNNSHRRELRKLMKKLSQWSHCSIPDDKIIVCKAIQRIELLEHTNEIKEEQIRNLILENMKLKEACSNQSSK